MEARRLGARGLALDEASGYSESTGSHDAFIRMVRAQHRLGRPDEALRYLERGRARATLDLLERSRVDPMREALRRAELRGDKRDAAELRKLAKRLEHCEGEVARWTYSMSRDATKEKRETLARSRRELRSAVRTRAEAIRRLLPLARPAAPEELQRMLGKRERMLVYALAKRDAIVMVVPPAGQRIRSMLLRWPDGSAVTRESVAVAVDRYVAALVQESKTTRGMRTTRKETGSIEDGARLGKALLPAAIRKELAGAERVFVVPHGALHRLPFETLVTSKGKLWLDELPPVAYAPSGSVLLWCRQRAGEQSDQETKYDLLALGDPVYGAGATPAIAPVDHFGALPALPGTRREVESIRATRKSDRFLALLGERANEPELFRLAPKARILHLATHQLVDESEGGSFSRLALTAPAKPTPDNDGFLSLYELIGHWRDRLSACELVVLSACETHKGPLQRDEGPYALPVGFLYAGTPRVIASLWRVDDQSTADLFSDFYKRLAAGKSKLEAFTEARKALRKKYPQPYFWAPFIYIGDPR